MVHFSECSGRVEEIFLPEDGPTPVLGANITIADAEWAEQEARGGRTPNRGWCSGRAVSGRERSGGVRGGVEEGAELGREEGLHGILPGGIRRGVRRHCTRLSGGSGTIQAAESASPPMRSRG